MENLQTQSNDLLNYDFDPYQYAAIYARTSIKVANYSIDAQISDCEEKLKSENLLLYKIYKDKESGRKVSFYARKEFKELLSDLEAGMFKTLIISKRDRLSRKIEDFIELKDIFKKHNIKVIYAKEIDYDFSDRNYISKFIDNMITAIAILEPDTTSKRTEDGRRYTREQGLFSAGRCPYGYKKEKKHVYEKNDAEANNVQKIFEYYLKVGTKNEDGQIYKMKDLVKEFKPLFPKKKNLYSFIYGIIQRPTYIGKMKKYGKYSMDDWIILDESTDNYKVDYDSLQNCKDVDKIVDESLWEKAVIKYYKENCLSPTKRTKYLFKNLAFCKKCKKNIALLENSYICPDECVHIEENEFIKLVFSKLIIDADSAILQKLLEAELLAIEKDISVKQKELKKFIEGNLRKAIQNYIHNPNDTNFKGKLEELETKEKSAKESISNLGIKKINIEYILKNIEKYKIKISDNLEDTHIKYFKNNIDSLENILANLIKKVVLNPINSHGKYSVDVKFKK